MTDSLDKALLALPPEAGDAVAVAYDEARARQLQALLEALDRSLRIAPRPLRGVLRKVLLG